MAFYTYTLVSEKTGRRYFGSCEDLQLRLARHNAGQVRSTKAFIPYRLFYHEEFATREEALRQEKFFKSVDGYRYLQSKSII